MNELNIKRKIQLHFRRFEFKYLISYQQHQKISRIISRKLAPDPFGEPKGIYTITNLYFDSPGLKYYYQNEAGLKDRQKIRHRFYNHERDKTFWEIKRKTDAVIIKDRCFLNDYSSAMQNQIRYFNLRDRLLPTLWVEYQREAWILPANDLRATFDFNINISSSRLQDRYPRFWEKKLLPGFIVMELKFNGRLPYWIYSLMKQFSLERQALGKYQFAVQNLFKK